MIQGRSIPFFKSVTRSVVHRGVNKKPSASAYHSFSSTSTDSSSPTSIDAPPTEEPPPHKPYIELYHHQDPALFPQIVPGSLPYILHNVSSAFNAVVTLFSSQEARDRFVSITNLNNDSNNNATNTGESDSNNLYNGSIINTTVLAQSDLGFIKVLALFDGLNSPLYDNTPFDIHNFMDGVAFAIQRFHSVSRDHMKLFAGKMESCKTKKVDNNADNEEEGFTTAVEESNDPNEFVMPHTWNADKDGSMSYNFLDIAKSDVTTLEHEIMNMTTPMYWKGFNETLNALQGGPSFLLDLLKGQTRPDSKITHLALLSARVASIDKPHQPIQGNDNNDDDPNAPLEDESLNPIVERHDTRPQIVTQLEVLYESEVTLTKTEASNANNQEHQNQNTDDDTVTSKTVVDVATFEACIDNDPNGEMRWRLCYTRPALEFGYSAGVPFTLK